MKKRTKIILIVLISLIALFFYGSRNFQNDKNHLLKIKSLAANGNTLDAISAMEKTPNFVNPPINLAYKFWKKKFNSRFVERNEIIKDKSENKIINDISNIYRKYWISSSLEESEQTLLDSVLMTSLY
ncbi:MAG: hypothetical protein HRT73_12385, partial [Flavobacteriales bacterium]|nr:hypothetical protein [Flavobacteriales bacterium]